MKENQTTLAVIPEEEKPQKSEAEVKATTDRK